jgi:hypothetical protein
MTLTADAADMALLSTAIDVDADTVPDCATEEEEASDTKPCLLRVLALVRMNSCRNLWKRRAHVLEWRCREEEDEEEGARVMAAEEWKG